LIPPVSRLRVTQPPAVFSHGMPTFFSLQFFGFFSATPTSPPFLAQLLLWLLRRDKPTPILCFSAFFFPLRFFASRVFFFNYLLDDRLWSQHDSLFDTVPPLPKKVPYHPPPLPSFTIRRFPHDSRNSLLRSSYFLTLSSGPYFFSCSQQFYQLGLTTPLLFFSFFFSVFLCSPQFQTAPVLFLSFS